MSSALGKRLAWLLRHEPEAYGLALDEGGWASVEALLIALAAHGQGLTRAQLEALVAADAKGRFTLSPDGTRVRAAQGHSIAIDLGLEAVPPPARLFHGTPERAVPAISREGLSRGQRHHVHLSADPHTAARVGERRGRARVFEIDAAAMIRDGHHFFRSENGVWLCEHVPPTYLRLRPGPGRLASGGDSGHESGVSSPLPPTRITPEALELPIPGLLGKSCLAARAWGRAGARPVLCMHGWLDNAASFDGLAPLLCAALDVRIVALDLPGHGLSDRKAGPYHFIDWPADALAAADALGWQRFTLMSHSMGAGISTLIAGAAPQRVDQLILLEGIGPMSDEPKFAAKRLGRSLRVQARKRGKQKRGHESMATAAERLREVARMKVSSALTLVERGLEQTEFGWVWRADPKLRLDSRMRLSEEGVHAFLKAITCPALLIRAQTGWPHDPAMVEARIALIQQASARCEVVHLDGRHHVHLDEPEAVAAVVVPFLESFTGGDPSGDPSEDPSA